MSLQQVAATKALCVYRSCDKLLQQVARHVATATNRFVRSRECLWKSLSQQQSFLAARSRTNSVRFDFVRLDSVAETKIVTKKFPRTHKLQTCRLVCFALKTFAEFHSGEHTQWNEVEAWADSFIQISEFCHPPKPHTFVHRNEGWVY